MSNSFYIIESKNDYLLLGSDDPYVDVKSINGYTEEIQEDTDQVKREFRWSNDKITYSQWIDLTNENLKLIDVGKNTNFWVQFRYTILEDDNLFLLSNIYLDVTYYEEDTAGKYPLHSMIEKGNSNSLLKIRPHTYNPYNQKPAMRLQKDLSYVVNSIYGHEISYFRAVPDYKSKDVILQEWTLYNVDNPVCIKVLIPDNNLPDSRFNLMFEGLQFEMPFEVHVDKRYFEFVFGRNEMPQKRDILYMPLMNRVYEINSSQPVRDFMNDILYYKMDLKKYEPKSHVFQDDNVRETLNDYTIGVEELLGDEIKAEELRVTAPQNLVDKTTKMDPIREYLDPNILCVSSAWENSYTTLSEFHYDLSALYKKNKRYETAIRYKYIDIWPDFQDRAYTSWFKEIELKSISKSVTTINHDGNNEYTLTFKYAIPNLKEGQWFELYERNRANWGIFGYITYVNYDISQLTIKLKIPDYIKTTFTAGYPNWESSTTLIGHEIARRNLFHSYNYSINKGIMIDTIDSKWFRITLNNIEYWIPITSILEFNTLYGLVVNVSNKFRQLSVYIYTINTGKSTDLDSKFKYILNDVNIDDRSSQLNCELKNSMLEVTNIRYLVETIEEEKHSTWLNQNIIRDSNLVLIVDNAIPRMRLPYIGTLK